MVLVGVVMVSVLGLVGPGGSWADRWEYSEAEETIDGEWIVGGEETVRRY